MTNLLPAVRSSVDLDQIARLGQWLALSDADDQTPTGRGAQAALRLYYAQQLDLPPWAASEISVIKGRLFVQARLLRALAARHGYRVTKSERSDDTTCTAVVTDSGTGVELGRYTFTLEDARRAGLIRPRSAWETHPGRMLWARAAKFALDDYAPEVTLGIGTDDEAAEIRAQPMPAETISGELDALEEYDAQQETEQPEPAEEERTLKPNAAQTARINRLIYILNERRPDVNWKDEARRMAGVPWELLTYGGAEMVIRLLEEQLPGEE